MTATFNDLAGVHALFRPAISRLMDIVEPRFKEGMPLAETAVEAWAAPFRLGVLAAAAVIRASAILFGRIFRNLRFR